MQGSPSSSSSANDTNHRIFVTQKLQLEFLVKENENAQFKSIPMELAKPLTDAPEVPEKRTYLVEVKPGWFFGLRMHSVFSLAKNTGFAAHILVDGIPTRTNNNKEFLTPHCSDIVSNIRGNTVGYPLQFAKSDILQDPSELRGASRKDVSVVGKIEMKFFNASFSSVGTFPQYDNPTPMDKIKIKESQTKDKGICAVASTAVPIVKPATCEFWSVDNNCIAEIVILYRDAIGMITEKKKRDMLERPQIRHSGITVDIPEEEEEEPPAKRVKKEKIVVDLEQPRRQSSAVVTDLEADDEELPLPSSSQLTIPTKVKPEPLSAKAKQVMTWSIEQVQEWLNNLDSSFAGAISNKFREEEITGRVLFTLTDEDLKSVFGVSTLGKRRVILDGIELLKQ